MQMRSMSQNPKRPAAELKITPSQKKRIIDKLEQMRKQKATSKAWEEKDSHAERRRDRKAN